MDPLTQAILSMLGMLIPAAKKAGEVTGKAAMELPKMAAKGLTKGSSVVGEMGGSLFNNLGGDLGNILSKISPMMNMSQLQAPQMAPPTQPPQLPQPPIQFNQQTPQNIQKSPQSPQQPSIPMDILKMLGKVTGIGRGAEGQIGIPEAFGKGLLGMPMDQEKMGWESYIGKLYPDIIRSKIGVPTTGEETRQRLAGKSAKITAEEKQRKQELTGDLSKAAEIGPNLTPEQKNSLFTELVSKYPNDPSAIRRILFPEEFYGKDSLSQFRTQLGL